MALPLITSLNLQELKQEVFRVVPRKWTVQSNTLVSTQNNIYKIAEKIPH
jgi:hypothetical protein